MITIELGLPSMVDFLPMRNDDLLPLKYSRPQILAKLNALLFAIDGQNREGLRTRRAEIGEAAEAEQVIDEFYKVANLWGTNRETEHALRDALVNFLDDSQSGAVGNFFPSPRRLRERGQSLFDALTANLGDNATLDNDPTGANQL